MGFSTANIAVTMGTKAEGDDQWRSMVNEWPMTATFCAGMAFIRGNEGGHVGLLAAAPWPGRRASRMCWFFSPQFQILRPAICHSAAVKPTGDAQLLPSSERPDGQKVLVASGKAELADVHGQAEADVEAEQLLQAVAVALDLEHRLVEVRHRPHLGARAALGLAGEVAP